MAGYLDREHARSSLPPIQRNLPPVDSGCKLNFPPSVWTSAVCWPSCRRLSRLTILTVCHPDSGYPEGANPRSPRKSVSTTVREVRRNDCLGSPPQRLFGKSALTTVWAPPFKLGDFVDVSARLELSTLFYRRLRRHAILPKFGADTDHPPLKRSKITSPSDYNDEDSDLDGMLSQVSITTTVDAHSIVDFNSSKNEEQSDNSDGAGSNNSEDNTNDVRIERNVDDPLKIKVSKMPLLDGTFFSVNMEQSSLEGPLCAYCMTCNKLLSATFRTTSNFTSHLKRMHSQDHKRYTEYANRNRKRSDLVVDRKRWSCTFDQDIFEENVTNLVLKFMLPYRIVEDPAFQKILNDFNFKKGDSTIQHLTRYSLGKRVEMNLTKTMDDVRGSIRLLIGENGVVCTTADVWTGGARRFLGVTVSWIDSKTLKRKSAALACKRFSGTHSYDAIANLLSDVHTSFGLTPETIRATVTDNASNFGKVFRKLGIEESDIIPSGKCEGKTPLKCPPSVNTAFPACIFSALLEF
ncbi:uncharacterized protein [Venturia canescens]|uniref:uncharacterized protein n=1 Tax=Venturia canescens TaxID=32260 RepID=UPI001C9C7637|nr:uncharacterized protein LOC122414925 [Venturia canescens]